MVLRNSLSFQLKETLIDQGGRYLIVTGDINSEPLYAGNIICPELPSSPISKESA